jgi:hypothetical protein
MAVNKLLIDRKFHEAGGVQSSLWLNATRANLDVLKESVYYRKALEASREGWTSFSVLWCLGRYLMALEEEREAT